MNSPLPSTLLRRFSLHPEARVFAGARTVTRMTAAPRHIPATPLADALSAVMDTVARGVPFAVADSAPRSLDALPDDCFATFTGGSTAGPKIISRRQGSWTASFAVTAARFGVGPDTGVAILGDLTHSLALYAAVEAMHLGATLHALSDFGPRTQAQQIKRAAVSVLYATPTQLRLLCTSDTDAGLPDLRVILCGGGALDRATEAAVRALCPNASLHIFYGAAETSFITIGDDASPAGSVGRAYPGVEIEIREGEIYVRSPYLFDRYLDAQSAHTRWDGDWLSLGETGWIDAQGHLFLRGRAGRMITVADRNVFLDELTAHLAPLAYPRHVAVLAQPDALRGQRPAILLSGTRDAALANTLIAACREACGTPPGAVHFLADFPLLASGKPDLKALETAL